MRERTIWLSRWRSQASYNTSLLSTDVIVMLDVDVKLELSSWFQAPRIRASCSCISLSRSGSSKLLTATARRPHEHAVWLTRPRSLGSPSLTHRQRWVKLWPARQDPVCHLRREGRAGN